jgi:hypothetical protein
MTHSDLEQHVAYARNLSFDEAFAYFSLVGDLDEQWDDSTCRVRVARFNVGTSFVRLESSPRGTYVRIFYLA